MATTQNQQSNAQSGSDFFNLHVSGAGYMSRVRWVTPKAGGGRRNDPFLSCSVNALRGHKDDKASTYFDLRVSGEEAIELVSGLEQASIEQRKIFVTFRLGDVYPHLYERDQRDQNGRNTGRKEWATLIKGRLLIIYSITIDGERIYTRPQGEAESDDGFDGDHDVNSMSGTPEEPKTPSAPAAPQGRTFAPAQRALAPRAPGMSQAAQGTRRQTRAPVAA